MKTVPLQAVPNQTEAVTLSRQPVQFALRQNGANLYFDLMSNGAYIVRSRVCRDRQRLLLNAGYRGFAGDFLFVDTQGADTPQFAGLGNRFQLVYLEAGE